MHKAGHGGELEALGNTEQPGTKVAVIRKDNLTSHTNFRIHLSLPHN